MNIDIKAVQNKILEIAKYFDAFCKEHDITYYLMGGSALGAVRHRGFIPWDDDLDVFMTFENYQKLIDKAEKYLDKENFYFQKENTKEWPLFFSKLRMNGTTFLEEDSKHRNMHQGVYIDIMCLNYVHENKLLRYVQYLSALSLTAQTIAERGYDSTNSFIKKLAMFFARNIVKGPIKNALLLNVRRYNKEKTEMVGHFFGKAPFSKTSFPKSWLGEPRYIEFEDTELPIPEKAEKYLELRFGDFMKMPDESTLENYPIHASFVDLEKDYSEYINS